MKHQGEYDSYTHLNDADLVAIKMGMKELAELIDGMNYGGHRFLSAWARVRLQRLPGDALAGAVIELLDQGLY